MRVSLACISGSLVGNRIVYDERFILHGNQWLSWSADLQSALAIGGAGGAVARGPPGLCPLL